MPISSALSYCIGMAYFLQLMNQKNIYFCFNDYVKVFDCVGHNKLGKILKEVGILDHLTWLLRHLYAGQEATVRNEHGTDWFQIGKEYAKAVYYHPLYLAYMQSTSCEMLSWMKHKPESRLLPGEISITSDMQIMPPLWQKVEKNKRASWWKWKRRVKTLA